MGLAPWSSGILPDSTLTGWEGRKGGEGDGERTPKVPPRTWKSPKNRSGACPPQAAPARNKREELNGIPSPGHPGRPPPPPPLPLLTPHKSFSELLGSHAGLQAGAKGKFWGWGRGHEDACPGNARLQGKGAGNPRAPNAGVRAGAEPLRTSTATSTTCPRCGLGTLQGQGWEIPAGDKWIPFPSPPAPSRPLLEQHPGVGTPRLDPKPSAATGQHGVSATSSWTDRQMDRTATSTTPKASWLRRPASLHLEPLRAASCISWEQPPRRASLGMNHPRPQASHPDG